MNAPPATSRAASPRLEGLDALRGIAAVLVIMLHASMPYLLLPMKGLIWPTRDARPSELVDAVGWAIEGFIMPLFFLLAGLFAAGLLDRLGPAQFLKHRARRLLVPMAFACVVILPIDLYVWLLGILSDGRCTWKQFRRLRFDPDVSRELWGFSHLWFLQYLFLACVGLVIWRTIRNRASRTTMATVEERSDAASPWQTLRVPLAATACSALLLAWEPDVVAGFQHAWLPVPPKFLHSLLFVALGAWLHQGGRSEQVAAHGPAWLGAALASFVVLLPAIHLHQVAPMHGLARVGLGILMATYAVGMSLGLYGVFAKMTCPAPRALRFLAEASFWIYLAHHPLVGLIQLDLAPLAWPGVVKFLAVTGITLALTTASYVILVRGTWLGTLLHGKSATRNAAPTLPMPAAAPPNSKAA